MSSYILEDKNFEYLKKEIIKYMMNEDGSYLIYELGYKDSYKDFKLISRLVNNQINYLHYMNVKSVNKKYNLDEIILYTEDYTEESRYYSKKSEEELLQLYQVLRCLNYQIEVDFDKEFIEKVTSHIAKTIAERRIECYDTIQWGL